MSPRAKRAVSPSGRLCLVLHDGRRTAGGDARTSAIQWESAPLHTSPEVTRWSNSKRWRWWADAHRIRFRWRALPDAVRAPGGARPVAAKRIDNPQFPVPFELTNADVMVQGSELRGMLDVVARLDRDGQAGPAQPGDIEGRYAKNPTLPGGRDFEITLDTVK